MATRLAVGASFTKNNGEPATGLTLADIALYLTAQHQETGVCTVVWDGTQVPTLEVDNMGTYTRIYTEADLNTYNYLARGVYSGGDPLDSNYTVVGTLAKVQEQAAGGDTVWFY